MKEQKSEGGIHDLIDEAVGRKKDNEGFQNLARKGSKRGIDFGTERSD